MPNHALTEANSLASRITELEEKINGLKPEPVDPKKIARNKETEKEYDKLNVIASRLQDKLHEQNIETRKEESQKHQTFQAVLNDLMNQKKQLTTLLSTALEAAKG